MATHAFFINQAFSTGWRVFTKNPWIFIGAALVSLALVNIPPYVMKKFDAASLSFGAVILFYIAGAAFWVANMIVSLGFIRVALKLLAGASAAFADLFADSKKIFTYLAASIIYGLIAMGGLILLIAPGIIFLIRFQFYAYFIVDKNADIVESLRLSWRATKGSALQVLFFNIVGIILTIGSMLVIGLFTDIARFDTSQIALLAAMPVVIVASTYVYNKLTARAV